jgi:uncharacterized protein
MSDFPCTGCGLCCRYIGQAINNINNIKDPVLFNALNAFPYKTDPDGSCEKLINNQCSVYENRPLVCNVSLMAQELNKAYGISKEKVYEENIKTCNKMILANNLDKKYLIPEKNN